MKSGIYVLIQSWNSTTEKEADDVEDHIYNSEIFCFMYFYY